MIRLRVVGIVEGDGEVESVPVLIKRFAALSGWSGRIEIPTIIRQSASKLLRAGELERTVELAARKLGGPGGILVLLDSDDACPAKLGPSLLDRVRQARSDLPTSLVLAHREFEAWFLAAADSIAGRQGLPHDLRAHPAPESARGCKEWLSRQMPRGSAYNPVRDQPIFTENFDMPTAQSRCPSFDKCHREVTALLQRVASITPGFFDAT